MSIQITITDAGRAEIINATNTGTAPVTITQVGLGTGQYTPAANQTALQTEIKRLSTIAGQVVADDTIHVTILDETNDAYNVSEFGLFTASGTLFAVYSQPTGPFMQKAAQSSLLLSVDIILGTLDATNITFGDTSFANPPASETVAGVVELATPAEVIAGVDGVRAVTPAGLAAAGATKLRTPRTLTIGNTGKSFDGSANVSWSLAEIGAAAATATVNLTGNQTVEGTKTFNGPIVANGGVQGDINYLPAGTGAVTTTVQDKLRELVSLADFDETAYHVVRVPSEYPTLQAAFDALAPGVFKSGQYIKVLIEAGHALTHGLELKYGDYSNFKISSVDPVVTLSSGMVFVGPYASTLWFDQCHAPIVDIKIDAGGAGGRTIGYTSARGKVEQGKGALNAGTSCLYMNSGSFVNAFRTVWEGGAGSCAWITRASLLDAEESSFSLSTGSFGITVRRGSTANITNSHVNNNASTGLVCTRSYVNFQGREDASGPLLAECNNNGADGVSIARGSRATLTGLQANNNTSSGIVVYSGSIADCDGCESTGNGVAGVRALDGGIISANAATLTGNNRAIICEGGASSISAPNADLSNSVAHAIQATNGARVSAVSATGTNCGGNTVDARDGANVTVTSGTFTGSGAIAIYCVNAIVTANSANCTGYTTNGIRAVSGSIYFQSGNAQKAGSDTTTDIEIGNGSIIHASGASGGHAATVTPNTISGTRGILFK